MTDEEAKSAIIESTEGFKCAVCTYYLLTVKDRKGGGLLRIPVGLVNGLGRQLTDQTNAPLVTFLQNGDGNQHPDD